MPLIPIYRVFPPIPGGSSIFAEGMDRAAVIARVIQDARSENWALPVDLVVQSMDDRSRWRTVAVLVITDEGEELTEVRRPATKPGRSRCNDNEQAR